MADVKHTPGPWEQWGGGYVRHRVPDRAGRKVAYTLCSVSLPGANQRRSVNDTVMSYDDALTVQDANARLIAAAPDLLAACKAAQQLIQFGVVYHKLEDAIKKATQ